MVVKERRGDHWSVVDRFMNHVEQTPEFQYGGCMCWIWKGGKSTGGNRWGAKSTYTTFNPGGLIKGGVRGHVFAAWLAGIVPRQEPNIIRVTPGFHVDHLCNRSRCVNPDHLDLIPVKQNLAKRNTNSIENDVENPAETVLIPFIEGKETYWLSRGLI